MDYTHTVADESGAKAAPNAESQEQVQEQGSRSMRPLISVIIPTYNQASLVIQTLASVLNQSYRNLEILVVDHGSTDETAVALQPYQDRIRYFYQERGDLPGSSQAINRGIKAAQGEYIHCLVAGDLVSETYYFRVMQAFHAQPHIGAVATDAYCLTTPGAATEILKLGHFKTQQDFLLEGLDHNPIVASTMTVRRFCYEAVGMRRSQFEGADDYDMWLRIGAQFEIAYLTVPLIQCRAAAAGADRDLARIRSMERQVVREFRQQTAIETFFPELRRQPRAEDYAQAHERVGRIFAGKGWYEEAVAEFEKAAWYQATVTAAAQPPTPSAEAAPGMRILFVLHNFLPHSFAGTELHTFHLARALQAAGHAISVLYPSFNAAQPEGTLVEGSYEGLKTYTVNVHDGSFTSSFRNHAVTEAFTAFLQTHPFDLIHFQHLLHMGGAVIESAKKQGLPTVLTLNDTWFLCQEVHLLQNRHSTCTGPETVDKCAQCFMQTRMEHPEQLTADAKAAIYQLVAYRKEYLKPFLPQVDLILSPSRYIQRTFAQYGLPADRITVMPLGIRSTGPAKPRQPQTGAALRFAFLGNIAPIKGLDTLVQAFQPLRGRAELHIYGGIPDPAYGRRIMEATKDSDHIVHHGHYSPEALPEILAGIDCLVLASLCESYSFVIREALHAGVPVIASDVGGLPEIIQDGVNGMLFPARDAAALQERVERICENPALLDAFRASIAPVRTLAAEVEDLQALYRRLLNRAAPAGKSTIGAPRMTPAAVPDTPAAPVPAAASVLPAIDRSRPPATPFAPAAVAAEFPRQDHSPLNVVLYSLDPMSWACPTIRVLSPLMSSSLADRFRVIPAVSYNDPQTAAATRISAVADINCIPDAGILVFQRSFPGVDGFGDLLAYARSHKKPIIYETDDNLIDLPINHPQKAYFDVQRERLLQGLSVADAVTVSTPKLRDAFLKYNSNIIVLPNAIDLDLWSGPREPRTDPRLALIYMGTITHDEDLNSVAPALKRILQKYQGRVVLYFWGYVPPALRHVAGVESIGRLDNNYRNFAQSFSRKTFDIALAPLTDSEFNRCKSAIKYLEYSACRIPGIYARLEPYSPAVQHGITGLLAGTDPDEWVAALERLIEDESLRYTLAENAYRDVVAHHTVNTRGQEWAALYMRLAKREFQPTLPAATIAAQTPAAAAATVTAEAAGKRVSIIIPVFNQASYTRNCLEALFANTPGGHYEVLVVDNGSTDETPTLLASYKGKVKLIRNDTNLGFAKACNQGARAARADYLVFLNNDTLPQVGWLDALVNTADRESQAAIVGAKLLYPDDTVQHAGVIFSEVSRLPYHLYRHFDKAHPAVNRLREFPAVTGACMLVKRSVFFAAGLFDEDYVNCYEDVDLCMKVREQGYKVLYNPESVVYHYESITEGRRNRDNLDRSYAALRRKWDSKMPTDEARYYSEDGLTFEYIDANNLQISPLSPAEQQLNRARALKSQGQFHAAMRTAEAIQEERYRFEVSLLLGDCCVHIEQPDVAAHHYQTAIPLNVQSERPHIGLGVLAVRRQQFEEAKAYFERALSLNPRSDTALCGLGIALSSQGQADLALEKYSQALDINPENLTALSNLQACSYERKTFGLAEHYFRRYLAQCPGDLQVRFGLAGIYTLMGDTSQARQALQHLLKLDPHHKDAYALLGRLDAPNVAVS